MKKILWRIAGVIGVLLLGGFLFFAYALHVHNEAMEEFKPYTLEELRALSEILDPSGSPGMVLLEGLPTRLNGVPSEEEMVLKHKVREDKEGFLHWLGSLILQVEDGIARLQDRPPLNGTHTSSSIGYSTLSLGDLESGRRYLWVAVDVYKGTDSLQCKFALGALSGIERDPEKAALLLHLSCQGSDRNVNGYSLFDAYSRCKTLGSHELADYFLERLWVEFPDEAKEYEIQSKIPSITISP